MKDTGQHPDHYAAGAPLRRAKACAWITALVMGVTTMTFQTYHSVTTGEMPWPLAVLEGVAPLLGAMLLMEIAAVWKTAPATFRGTVYVLMGAAMFWAAAATGAVVLHTAPWHLQMLFGALLDGPELAAAYFLMNGPAAHQAVAAVAAREAELLERIGAERSARETAERSGRETAAALEAELGTAQAALADAQAQAREALTRQASLTERLAAASAKGPRAMKASGRSAAPRPGNLERETNKWRAVMELRDHPELCAPGMGGELARRLEIGASTGRRFLAQLTAGGELRPEYRAPAQAGSGER